MYDRAPNGLERIEMTYRYYCDNLDPWESNTIGNSRNTDSERNPLIRETRRDFSRMPSALSRILSAILLGKPLDGQAQPPSSSLLPPSSIGLQSSTIGKLSPMNTRNLIQFWPSTERTLREPAEEWKDIIIKNLSTAQTWSKAPWELISSPNLSPWTQLGDKTSENNFNWPITTMWLSDSQ